MISAFQSAGAEASGAVLERDLSCLCRGGMNAARRAQGNWARRPVSERVAIVRLAREKIASSALEVARTSAGPRNRPIEEVLTSEVLPLLEACRFLEREAASWLRPKTFGPAGSLRWLGVRRSTVEREALGVLLIIGPGNYPLFLPGVQLLQGLVAGNAVLLKPGKDGTAAAELLRTILIESGLDPDLLVVLPEMPAAAQAAIQADPDKVIFTGSAAVGGEVLQQLALRLIPASVELSGSDAVIVCGDADLDLVVNALRFGLRLNGGATCIGPRRLFVDRSIATELEGRLSRAFEDEPREQLSGVKACDLVSEALLQGAHLVCGACQGEGTVQTPLILAGVTPAARILQSDIFAPVLSIVTVANGEEAVRLANNSVYGLGASIFTRDEALARKLARSLAVGVVTINDLIIPTADPRLPFGGRGRSGFGATRGGEGLLELTRPKVVTVSRGRRRLAFERPRGEADKLFAGLIEWRHGVRLATQLRGLFSLVRTLITGRSYK